jgi:two-component system, chemotaxis family, chemotaxis protein CheY
MIRILIVDDSAAMRAHVRATLEDAHDLGETLHVVAAASGFEALRLLHRAAFDVVLLDIRLPDMDGLDLIRFIRQNAYNRGAALVVLSSFSSASERVRASALGAHAFVAKPFSPEVMTDTLLRTHSSRQARMRIA